MRLSLFETLKNCKQMKISVSLKKPFGTKKKTLFKTFNQSSECGSELQKEQPL